MKAICSTSTICLVLCAFFGCSSDKTETPSQVGQKFGQGNTSGSVRGLVRFIVDSDPLSSPYANLDFVFFTRAVPYAVKHGDLPIGSCTANNETFWGNFFPLVFSLGSSIRLNESAEPILLNTPIGNLNIHANSNPQFYHYEVNLSNSEPSYFAENVHYQAKLPYYWNKNTDGAPLSFVSPLKINLSRPANGALISIDEDLPLQWNSTDPNEVVYVRFRQRYGDTREVAVQVTCAFANTGEAVIPKQYLANVLPPDPSRGLQTFIEIARKTYTEIPSLSLQGGLHEDDSPDDDSLTSVLIDVEAFHKVSVERK